MSKEFDFKDALSDLLDQAAINGNRLKASDIEFYFSDLGFSHEQLNHIYAYLMASGVHIDGLDDNPQIEAERDQFAKAAHDSMEEQGKGSSDSEKNEEKVEDSMIVKLYEEELAEVEKMTRAEEREILDKIIDEENIEQIAKAYVERKLPDVVKIAREYKVEGEYLEELIEEGNIGLMMAVKELSEQGLDTDLGEDADPVEFIEDRISKAMQDYIDNELTTSDQGNAMAAKANFVSDAAKRYKEEHGENPTTRELALYTNLTEEEIGDIIRLTSNKLVTDK